MIDDALIARTSRVSAVIPGMKPRQFDVAIRRAAAGFDSVDDSLHDGAGLLPVALRPASAILPRHLSGRRRGACLSGTSVLTTESSESHGKKLASDDSFDMGAGSAGPESPNITRTPDSLSRLTPIMAPRKERLSLRHAESGPLPRRSEPSVVKFFVLNPLEIISATAMNEPAPSPVLARSGSRTREIKRRGRQALRAPLIPDVNSEDSPGLSSCDRVLVALRKSSVPMRILPACFPGRIQNRKTWGILDHGGSVVGFSGSRLVGETVAGEHEGALTIANQSAQELGAQLPCRPRYPRIRTGGKRTPHGARVIYRAQGSRTMSIKESPRLRRAIQTQRGRKTRKIGGTLQRVWTSHRIGPPPPGPPSRGGESARRSGREPALRPRL